MSNVIKGCELVMMQPKIMKTIADQETENYQAEIIPIIKQSDLEREELEQIKAESQKLLTDTESMVMELLDKARDDAKSIIANAKEEAEAIIAQAKEEGNSIRKSAEEEGYQQGLKKAQEEIEADRQLALEQSRQIIEEARKTKLITMKSIENDAVRLIMAVARKVIGGELIANPDVIVNVVRQAINFLDNPKNVTVYVNTQDVERLLAAMEQQDLTEIGSGEININVHPDNRMERGGCLIESDTGRVDAQVETRLNSVEKAIQEVTADE